jgi:predicted site-specific integrase-resolvase
MASVKPLEWTRANKVSRQTATRWFHAGLLPVLAQQLATGTILVSEPARGSAGGAIYARARFGVEYLKAALAAQGRKLIVVEQAEVSDDLVRDMVEILTSFCARLHGRRSAMHRAELALAAASKERAAY